MKPDILIVDDERDIRAMVRAILEDEGYSIREAANASEARQALSEKPASLAILDIWMRQSDMDGLELQKWIRRLYPYIPTLMISGHGNIETAVQAMKDGAFDFVEKPFKSEQLLLLISRALAASALEAEHEDLKRHRPSSLELKGISPAIQAIRQTAKKVAQTNSRVLIAGPSGTGKELLARNIHAMSDRNQGRFVVANCALLSSDKLMRQLFGTESSDNQQSRVIGLFERAHGGTLYFDEICDLPLETQGKMVRTMQDQRFRRGGGTMEVEVDVRIIGASTHNLAEEVAAGKLREDFFYRLNVVPITLPSLAKRREDIPELARHFLEKRLLTEGKGRALSFSEDALAVLRSCSWPGNITHLRNMVDWITIIIERDAKVIAVDNLPPEVTGNMADSDQDILTSIAGLPLKAAREHFETRYLLSQLARFNGNVSKTAAFIGMERAALHRKLKSLDIHAENLDNSGDET